MFKINNRNTRIKCEICSKLTIKTPERRQQPRSDIFIVNFEIQALTKSMSMRVCVVSTLIHLFIKVSYTEFKFSKEIYELVAKLFSF